MTTPSELSDSIVEWAKARKPAVTFTTSDVYKELDFIDNQKSVSDALRYMFKKLKVARKKRDERSYEYALADVAPDGFEMYGLGSSFGAEIIEQEEIETVTTGYDKVEENISSGCADQQADVSTHNGIDIVKDTMYRGVSFDIDWTMLEERHTEPVDSIQIGGDHYKKMAIQPWNALKEWMTAEQFNGFLKGSAIVYLARCDSKGGMEDIKKARHCLDKLIEVSEK